MEVAGARRAHVGLEAGKGSWERREAVKRIQGERMSREERGARADVGARDEARAESVTGKCTRAGKAKVTRAPTGSQGQRRTTTHTST